MSNNARRVLALAFCVVIGTIALVHGVEQMGSAVTTRRVVGVLLLLCAGFLLLSAVGLLGHWLPKRPLKK